jgi:hypothetical protein
MALALAAPHKEDVAGVWTYRVAELDRLGVPIRLRAAVTVEAVRAYAPDLIFVATGARPRRLLFTLDVAVPVLPAWHILLNPEAVASGAAVTIIGGGIGRN